MLRELRVRDFAIIDELRLEFDSGLNVLTGETGAGKSIIMQAIDLVCGNRASPEVVRKDAEEASIEALFDLGAAEQRWLEELGLDGGDELLIRRLVSRAGRSRVYLNGTQATVALLDRIGPGLIHVYGQLEHAVLLRPESHLALLDDYAGHGDACRSMAAAYGTLTDRIGSLDLLRRGAAAARERAELLRFQLQELQAAALQPGEEEELRREREVLIHAERLVQICNQGEEALYSGEGAVCDVLGRLLNQVREAARIDPSLGTLPELLDGADAQLHEVADRLRSYAARQHFDAGRRDEIEERLAVLQRLKRKYGGSVEDAIASHASLVQELAQVESSTRDAESLEAEIAAAAAAAQKQAAELSARRAKAARRLEREMKRELRALGMVGAVFSVRIDTDAPASGSTDPLRAAEGLAATGADRLEFDLAANPGEELKPLSRIASGGELSRIMLALKVLTAGTGEVPTLIFDEVDAGIGGTVAHAVGQRLHHLAKNVQVLCITHLPQIAAQADHHFVVQKRVEHGRTASFARPLAADERVAELSRMLGGKGDAEAARFARRLTATRAPGS